METPAKAPDAASRLDALVEGSDDAIIGTDLHGVIFAWNRGAERLYGYSADEAIGRQISLIYREGEVPLVEKLLTTIGEGDPIDIVEATRVRGDGTLVEVEVRISPIADFAGNVIGASSIARGIGERLHRERELRESQEFLEHTQQIGRIGSWKTDIGPESIFTWTPETYRIIGFEPGTVVRNVDLFNLIHPEDQPVFVEWLIKVRSDRTRSELELRFTRPDGERRWLLIVADAHFDHAGQPTGMIGIAQDITERKEAELRLEYDAVHDQLTGLANRVLFLDRAQRAIDRSTVAGSMLAVFCLDIDRFKIVNDSEGADAGDDVLRTVAERLLGSVPVTDTVARFSADEFGIVCEHMVNASGAAERATHILRAFEQPFVFGAKETFLTASIGIALGGPGSTADSLVRDAEIAMHRAKEQGRNRFDLFDIGLRDQVQQRFAFEAQLRRAIERNGLFLEYQPIASLDGNRYVGAEALIRWEHPERGVVPPNDFIPVAEEIGAIVPIGTWVIETACAQISEWRSSAPSDVDWYVSVNVAAAQLGAPDFADVVERVLADSDLDSSALHLELTESALVESGVPVDVLKHVRDLGVHISLDDFGTKYSSLSYLTRLPIDELKIDLSFVEGVVEDDSKRAVVSAILAIGRSLGLGVIAEGVETKEQLHELRALGCDTAQGAYFASSMAPDACVALLGREHI